MHNILPPVFCMTLRKKGIPLLLRRCTDANQTPMCPAWCNVLPTCSEEAQGAKALLRCWGVTAAVGSWGLFVGVLLASRWVPGDWKRAGMGRLILRCARTCVCVHVCV